MAQFVDFCMLCGCEPDLFLQTSLSSRGPAVYLRCDYLEHLKGVGPTTAYKLLTKHGSLKEVAAHSSPQLVAAGCMWLASQVCLSGSVKRPGQEGSDP